MKALALLALAATLKAGQDVAVTPDGPRGPRHAFAPGALVAAHRAGVPVVGLVSHVDRMWRLNSWDRFEIPKPFARITIGYTEPFFVPGRTPADAAAAVGAERRAGLASSPFDELLHAAVVADQQRSEAHGAVLRVQRVAVDVVDNDIGGCGRRQQQGRKAAKDTLHSTSLRTSDDVSCRPPPIFCTSA